MKFKKTPSQRKLKEDFTYNPITGNFLRYDGAFGYITKQGYSSILYEGETYLIHRLIWKWVHNEEPDEVDHINGDRLDNRLINLRNAGRKTNSRNHKKVKHNTSGFTGVTRISRIQAIKEWCARVSINGEKIHIGVYETPQEAADARDSFIKEFYPDHFTERHGT